MALQSSMNFSPCCTNPVRPRRSSQATAKYTSQKSISTNPAYKGDSYVALGLRPGSTKQDIKSAYRRLALQYHPDVCKGEHCVPKFNQITAAYEALQGNSNHSADTEEEYWTDEEEDEQYQAGWEGAWVF